jgi:hypothetical protein
VPSSNLKKIRQLIVGKNRCLGMLAGKYIFHAAE